MKKTMMAMMAAAMMLTTGTALAATPGDGNLRDGTSRIEANYAHCGGYNGGGRGGRDGRGGYGCSGYGGGYCRGNESSNEA